MEKAGYLERCSSSLLAAGVYCLVYGEDALGIPESFARAVAAEFDGSIYFKITGAFGVPLDLDENGRVIILLHAIQEPNYGDGSYTAGYFNPNDLFDNYYSNRGEILYINYKNTESNNFYPTMAHELQHLINRSLHLNNQMDLWIDEGLASAAEYLYSGDHHASETNSRIGWFNNDPQATIRQGNNFFIWYGYWEDYLSGKSPPKSDRLANYATAYLFFQWLRIHAANDSEIYRDIVNSEFTDYRAVTEAAENSIPGFSAALDGDEKEEDVWAELLGAWYAANYGANRFANLPQGAEEGIYGYEGEITLNFNWSYPESGHSVPLYPGEGVYSGIKTTINEKPSGGEHIRYLGLDGSGGTVDFDPPYDTKYLLTYNGAVTGASSETGYVADMVPVPVMSLSMAAAAGSGGTAETPEAILRRWDGGRAFLEKMQDAGTFPADE
jgi:hypothetical protein